LGAIGNGFVWALGRIDNLTGDIDLVDGEKIELPNLQRYILADQQSVNQVKVDIASRYLDGERLRVNPYPKTWEHFINERNNWSINQVALAVDSAKDRITIQGALPKKIFNSWTQLESLGISRHFNFIDFACVTCLYIPNAKKKNRSEEIAENLGLFGQQYEMLVRGYLALNKSVDENLISLVSTAKNIPIEVLRHYVGKPVDIFYSEFVCGGIMMKLSGENNSVVNVEVPCAFESAMAGILLAAEVVIDAEGLREPIPPITRFNLLRPLGDYLLEDIAKHSSGKCICQDEIFKNAYRSKYVIDK
jgi:molybdopterin/thiamine biosynthesis adenylyltransferase